MHSYEKAAIIVTEQAGKRVKYDVSNNRITAQFDGLGGISKYAVMNNFSVFSSYYAIFCINGKPFDYSGEKQIAMLGRAQKTSFSYNGASVCAHQFLDNGNNAVYNEISVTADKDTEFSLTVNFGIDYLSYLQQLFSARLSARTLFKLVAGQLSSRNSKDSAKGGLSVLRGNVLGDYYIDVAADTALTGLECERKFFNQFCLKGSIRKGEGKTFRYVVSAGARESLTFCDAAECLNSFDIADKQSKEYCDYLADSVPLHIKDGALAAYYASSLNSSLSNYKELGEFKGFLAGIVYQFPARTYYRDSYWTALAALKTKPDWVKNQIITLTRGVSRDGKCPSAVKFNFKNHWGDHYDSPSFLPMLVHDYIAATGNKDILTCSVKGRTVLATSQKALDKLSEHADETGLLVKKGAYNRRDWCDNVFRNGYVTYDEILYARALYCMSALMSVYGDERAAQAYYTKHLKVKAAINEILWDKDKGYYINYKNAEYTEGNLSVDTVIAALFGIADKEKAVSMLAKMEALLESRNNKEQPCGDFGVLSVYPVYGDPKATVQKSSLPYYYHNGGDWPYLSNIYAYAKMLYGMDYIYPLTRWFEYNIEKGNYTPVEFYNPLHPDGSLLQAWSSTGAFVLDNTRSNFFDKKIKENLNDQ